MNRLLTFAAAAVGAIMAFTGPISAQTSSFAVNVSPGETKRVDAHGVCRMVKNLNDLPIMVPTRSATEWSSGQNAFLFQERRNIETKSCLLCNGKLFVDSAAVTDIAAPQYGHGRYGNVKFASSGNGNYFAMSGSSNGGFGGGSTNADPNLRFYRKGAGGGMEFINAIRLVGANPDTSFNYGSEDGVFMSMSFTDFNGPLNISIYERNGSGIYERTYSENVSVTDFLPAAIRSDGQSAILNGGIYNKVAGSWQRVRDLPADSPLVALRQTSSPPHRMFDFGYRWNAESFRMVYLSSLNTHQFGELPGASHELAYVVADPSTLATQSKTNMPFFGAWTTGDAIFEFSNDGRKFNVSHQARFKGFEIADSGGVSEYLDGTTYDFIASTTSRITHRGQTIHIQNSPQGGEFRVRGVLLKPAGDGIVVTGLDGATNNTFLREYNFSTDGMTLVFVGEYMLPGINVANWFPYISNSGSTMVLGAWTGAYDAHYKVVSADPACVP